MTRYLIMCHTLTQAQRSARLLERAGITATVVKAEGSPGSGGCRYAVQLLRHFDDAVRLLQDREMIKGKIYRQSETGKYEEIRL